MRGTEHLSSYIINRVCSWYFLVELLQSTEFLKVDCYCRVTVLFETYMVLLCKTKIWADGKHFYAA